MNQAFDFDLQKLISSASTAFYTFFHSKAKICSYAPGRVNLIGEHTDYNDGFVLPMALSMGTVIVAEENGSNECHIITSCQHADEPKEVKFMIPEDHGERTSLKPDKPMWANYIKGVIANFKGKLVGFNAVVSSNVPVGGGLSSSAALEVSTYCVLEALSNDISATSTIEKALACQRAEHDFLGMPCGIMDQFISFMGQKDHALLLDCRSLDFHLIKLNDPEITVLITNTNVRHKLAESQYSNRRKQCEKAAEIIGKPSLRDVTLAELQSHRQALGDEVYHRALHVVGEIIRTVEAAEALKKEDYAKFGVLMNESHTSLRDNYQVSCPELDTVVNAVLEVDGVFGSRMTGGGFGGCTVTLLKTYAIPQTIEHIKIKYKNPTFFICRPGDGARLLKISDH